MLESGLAKRASFAGAGPQVLALEKKDDWKGLVRLARERLAREPDNPDWEIVAGYALLQLQDYGPASAALARATRRSPEDIDAWNLLGESQRLSGDAARAVRTLEHTATISRTSNVTYFLLGQAYRDSGRPDRAVQALGESIRIQPDFAASWFSLGLVYVQTGQREQLDAVLEQLRKLNRPLAQELEKARDGVGTGSKPPPRP
jgi:tetratricopeptide (TPR) repeat protein